MKNQLLILMVLTISLSSCRKEKIVTEYITKDDHSWNSYDNIDSYGTYGFGVSVYNNALYVLTSNYMVYYDGKSYLGKQSYHREFRTKMPFYKGKMLQMPYKERLIYVDYEADFSPNMIIDTFYIKDLSSFYYGDVARSYSAINDKNNQFFTFYLSTVPQPSDSVAYSFCMFQYLLDHRGLSNLTNFKFSKITIPRKPFYITATYAHFGNYFITSSDGIMLIDSSANSKMVLNIDNGDVVQSLFRTENTLYAMSNYFMYRSDDYGMTWIKAYAISSQLGQFLYTNVDGEIFGYGYDNLIQMKITPDSLDIKTIYNKGLKNRYITGIAKYNSDIIVTTTAGTYIKPYIDLFYKE